jgi:hypothetical protein
MLELARRLWSIFIPAFAVLTVGGFAPFYYLEGDSYKLLIAIILWSLAFVCLVIAVIALWYDIADTIKKHREANAPSIYEDHGITAI